MLKRQGRDSFNGLCFGKAREDGPVPATSFRPPGGLGLETAGLLFVV